MDTTGRLLSIFIGERKGGELRSVPEARARPGEGLEGDRHCRTGARPDQEVTLIEMETFEALRNDGLPLEPRHGRRNLLTQGIRLNDLVGREFFVGEVRLRGIEPCHPCGHLESLTRPGVKRALRGRGGLRAQILEGGILRAGDAVRRVE